VPFVIGARTSLLVALDWTDFDGMSKPPSYFFVTIPQSISAWLGVCNRFTPLSKIVLARASSLVSLRNLGRYPADIATGLILDNHSVHVSKEIKVRSPPSQRARREGAYAARSARQFPSFSHVSDGKLHDVPLIC
jgi:hypothetical protein